MKILIAGGNGFVGRNLNDLFQGTKHEIFSLSKRDGFDLIDFETANKFFRKIKPDIVINCAALVGGIQFGLKHEGEIFYQNILMNTYLLECCRVHKVKKTINLLSNCSYPNFLNETFTEERWWDGKLHDSVLVYGFAKKAAWVQSYAYHRQYGMKFTNFLVPNMYGPWDHFEEERSHALGALIMKISKAKNNNVPGVTVWGTGKPVREWLFVKDCAEAVYRALDVETDVEPINLGQGFGISIKDLAEKIKILVGYKGDLVYDATKPDGAPYKIMDVKKLKKVFNWIPQTSIDEGLNLTLEWYLKNIK